MPLLSRNLKGYVPDGRQTGIANNKYPAGVNQFTKDKVIHSGAVQYNKTDVIDDSGGAVAANKYQGQVKDNYITNLKEKDREHFGSAGDSRGPMECLFMQLDFKPLIFGTIAECSTNVNGTGTWDLDI